MSEPERSSSDSDIAVVRKAVEALGEHFDTVQIFVTRYEAEKKESQTVSVHDGMGNWHARYGQVLEWITTRDEYARKNVRENPRD